MSILGASSPDLSFLLEEVIQGPLCGKLPLRLEDMPVMCL